MLPDEVCELIGLDSAEIEKQWLNGRLRFTEEENGTKHYSIVDIINLKDAIDSKKINQQVDNMSIEEDVRYYRRKIIVTEGVYHHTKSSILKRIETTITQTEHANNTQFT